MLGGQPLTILCVSSYEKGQEFIRTCKAAGCRVLLLTVEKLRHADWPFESIDEVFTMPEERSEEHTSELQSQSNLVCRLLLEKKKMNFQPPSLLSILTLDPNSLSFFFFNDTATTEIYTLSLHDALPIFSSYEKGQEFIRTCKAAGCRVLLLTVEKLRHADWPFESIDEVFTMPEE